MEKKKMTDRKSPGETIKGLAEYRRQRVMNWLNKKWPIPQSCPICRRKDWSTGGTIHELREFHSGSFFAAGSVFPVVPIVCNFCGYTLFFNAFKLGLIEHSKKEGEKKNG